ncbi:ABC transporter substrate-binding protein [Pseudonocardia kunmingensis]|uniref:Peptide/nickel transport system substrate-binding protein n=1 Tax=Pseudonocardia kunmingensis TaxID=630975 RepID=A0A543DPT0_9PSEU|nr:ABC transporter substrate-binding protein [Pseudonocardia kunmingensis]TQM11330.1 peptide/nickel transport system substrate-binding protein [Pseudonocardia kunmingensis]
MNRTTRALAAVLGAAMLVITGCGGGAGSGASTATELVTTQGVPAAPTGTLRYATWQETPSFDPPRTTTQNGPVIFPVYDTLTSMDENFDVVPWLATGWSQPDPSTWRFTLRDDVVFHDGSRFDAETVKLNLERAKTVTGGPYTNIYAPIAEVTVLDPVTVDVAFSVPSPNFPYSMATVAGAMVSPKAVQDGTDLTRNPAGSGGWIWEAGEHREGAQHVFRANPDYWNRDAVKAETVEVKIIQEDNARLNATQSGQADVMATLQPGQIEAAESAGLRTLSDFTITASFLIMDREGSLVPAFAEPKVREAVGYLLDREAYNMAVLAGKGESASGGFAAPGSTWYDPELESLRQADVDKARQLLAEAGYPQGFSFQVGNQPVIKTVNETVAQLLADGGITMEIVDVGQGQYTAEVRKGHFPAGYFVPTSIDIDQWWTRTVSNAGIYNPFDLTDLADLDARYAEGAALSDPPARKAVFDELQRATVERGVLFPLSQIPRSAGLRSTVHASQQPVFAPEDIAPRPFHLWAEQ